MKVENKGNSRVWITNDKMIRPGERIDVTEKEAKKSGVQALMESGELEKVSKKISKKKKDASQSESIS